MADILCLRPKEDFLNVGVVPPDTWEIAYRDPGDAEVAALLGEARALVLPSAGRQLEPALFQDARRLELIQYTGAGWDRIPEAVVRDLGCPAANVPGVNAQDVAEYVIITAGTLLRKFKRADQYIWSGQYDRARSELAAERVRGFSGLVVGVVGLGHIGFTVGNLFRALGARVVYFDPQPRDPEGAEQRGMRRLSLDELLAQADVVTIHVPLVPATVGLIGPAQLARLKPDAIVIQASRGGVVDEMALLQAVREERVAGVALDVYTHEPLPGNDPVIRIGVAASDRILLTPHIAGVTRQAAAKLYEHAWSNVKRVLIEHEPPLYRVI